MKYCLIGEKLGHSYSSFIHNRMGVEYSLQAFPASDLPNFAASRKFDGFNVTIPYKKTIIPYLDGISQEAKKIGAVNTVINKNGKLLGYNTDYFGLTYALKKANIAIKNKNVIILGSGGASLTAQTVCQDQKAKSVTVVSRTGQVNYDNVYDKKDAQVVINCTPVGMFLNSEDSVIDLSKFPLLVGAFDLIYNPLRTKFILQAESLGVKVGNGLRMLVAQAVKSEEIWQNKKFSDMDIENVYKELLREKSNVVLIGMACCGKSTIGKSLATKLGKNYVDTDEEIFNTYGKTPQDIILKQGESVFRQMEREVVKKVARLGNYVIATGGGVCLNGDNVSDLKMNGIVVLINRNLDLLNCDNRPISKAEGIKELYARRKSVYENAKDFTVENNSTVSDAVESVEKIYENFSN